MKSIWSESCSLPERESLKDDIVVEAAVIGAGMAGLLTAYFLEKQGLKTVVLEGFSTVGGVTKNTTAKITSQHDLIYDRLIQKFGVELAGQYAWANQRAIKTYREMIKENQIDCGFEIKPSFVYSLRDAKPIEDEAVAAGKLGIEAEFTTITDLPFAVKAAVKFENQAQFNPLQFLRAISKDLTIYEHTMAREIRDDVIITEHGRVTADHIVVATHFPFVNIPGWYFARMHQERSYVIALKNAVQLNGMYIDENPDGYSFRNYGEYLLLGGAPHRTGKHPQKSSYETLRKAAKELFPQSEEVACWSAQDCVTWDNVPYIGQYAASTPNLYVATGFKKWGMTGAMAAAEIITDSICGRQNDCAEVFSPQRFHASASMKNLLTDAGHSVAGLTAGALSAPSRRCAHLGCRLQWNEDEKTWDCPCHGSRYDSGGKLLDGPATKGLSHE